MKSTNTSSQQDTFMRARYNSYFDGMQRGETAISHKGSNFDFQENLMSKNINRSASDIGYQGSRYFRTDNPKNSPSGIVLEPAGQSLSGRWSKTSSPLVVFHLDLNMNLHKENELSTVSYKNTYVENEEVTNQNGLARLAMQRSYHLSKRQTDISNVPLSPSAALYYYGPSPLMEVAETCESVQKLNLYLKAKRFDVNAGVPERFLHAVIGPDVAGVGSVASTIVYAYYLDLTHSSNQFCIVPVINMKRAVLDARADLHWLLNSCHIDPPSLICIDEIDLSYYDLFGSLEIVSLNRDKIPFEQEALKGALVEDFPCTKSQASPSLAYSIITGQDASFCTVIAEIFLQMSPEILVGQGFSRILLAGILVDTGNLSSPQCTSEDKYMATLLINGAGRFGCDGLYQILKYKANDSADLKVVDILRKEYKKWDISGKADSSNSKLLAPNMGMSSIGMSVAQMFAHDSNSIQEIIQFQNLEKLGLLMVVSGYYDSLKKFKREILVSAESAELLKNLLLFLNSNAAQLPLKFLSQPGLKEGMRVFEIEKVTSRRTIEWILEEFSSASL